MENLFDLVLVYIILINVISVIVCVLDKYRAKTGGRRVSEKSLFLLCFWGGSVGMYITMRTIRHKTLHKRFMIGIPCIIILQIILVSYLILR